MRLRNICQVTLYSTWAEALAIFGLRNHAVIVRRHGIRYRIFRTRICVLCRENNDRDISVVHPLLFRHSLRLLYVETTGYLHEINIVCLVWYAGYVQLKQFISWANQIN